MKYEVITLDVWGNAKDGWDVNQAFHTGRFVEIPEDASDYLINRRLGLRNIEWDGEPEFQLFGDDKRNGKPRLQLHRVAD